MVSRGQPDPSVGPQPNTSLQADPRDEGRAGRGRWKRRRHSAAPAEARGTQGEGAGGRPPGCAGACPLGERQHPPYLPTLGWQGCGSNNGPRRPRQCGNRQGEGALWWEEKARGRRVGHAATHGHQGQTGEAEAAAGADQTRVRSVWAGEVVGGGASSIGHRLI